MSSRTFLILFVVVAALAAALVAMHTPGGQGAMRSMRALHGGRD
jgi:hypothetical protein